MFKGAKKHRQRTNCISLHMSLLCIVISFMLVGIAAAGRDKPTTAQRAAKRHLSRGSKAAQSFAAPTAASAAKKSKPLRRPRPESRSRNFSEVEIAISENLALDDISALPRAPGSNLTVLNNPRRVRVQLPISEIKALVEQGAEVTMLRDFVLVEGPADGTDSLYSDAATLGTCSGTHESASSGFDVDIPVDGIWVGSIIDLSGASAGNTVTCVDVHYEIEASLTGFVYAELSDEDYTIFNYPLVDGVDGYISETETGISAFNGKAVDQWWILWARESYSYGDGYIDYWWIKVYYGSAEPPEPEKDPNACDIEGYKFDDADGNGLWDPGEAGLADWMIYLDTNTNGQYDPGEPNAMTDLQGHYELLDLDPGTYTVAEVMRSGWTQTMPGGNGTYQIIAEPNQVYPDNNFGNTTAPTTATISGYVKTSGGVAIEGVLMSANTGGSDTTDENGYYELTAPTNPWIGSITPSKNLWSFNPSVRNYANLTSNISNQNFTGTYTADTTPTISGFVKSPEDYDIEDVLISASTGETTTTDNDGYYQLTVSTPGPIPVPWEGTITAAKNYWSFEPPVHSLANLTADVSDVDFTGTYTENPTPTISGHVQTSLGEGIENVLIFTDNYGGSTLTDENGYYQLTVPELVRPRLTPWTGTATPYKTDWSFEPTSITYTELHDDISGQNYVGTYIGDGCNSGWIEEWVARYHGNDLELYTDAAQDIAVDNLGNIYVTGSSYNRIDNHGSYDYATVKYDSNGNQLWVARYDGPANGTDGGGGFTGAMSMTVDNSGNVYVTGYSRGEDTYYDYATIKYDTNGNELWVARYDGPGNYTDEPAGIAVDNTGNVYVTGDSGGFDGYDDYATIKYDPNGIELWVARYDGIGNGNDHVNAIEIDEMGNVYVTGGSDSIYDGDCATIKYDSEGNELWVAIYNGDDWDQAEDIALDDLGNVYITGSSVNSAGDDDILTIRYDPNGYEVWVAEYDGPDNNNDNAGTIAVDNFGNVYVSGTSIDNVTGSDYATIKYDSDSGQLLWVATGNGSENRSDYLFDMTLDDYGNVYVTGVSNHLRQTPPAPPLGDYMTIKYAPGSNEPLWIATYQGPPTGVKLATAIVVDNSNNVYVTGDGYSYTTIKYSQCPISVDLDLDNSWMYQNLPGQTTSTLTANSIIDDPSGNSSYSYQWQIIFPSDVDIEPPTVTGGGSSDQSWTFAAPGCDEPTGISDLGETFQVKVTVTGNDQGNTGSAQLQFGIALLGDVNNDTVVNVADRGITNAFWRNGSAGSFTLADCDVNCDGVINVADRGITNAIWRGLLGSNSITNSCPLR